VPEIGVDRYIEEWYYREAASTRSSLLFLEKWIEDIKHSGCPRKLETAEDGHRQEPEKADMETCPCQD
jgi:hypothetical protein